MTRAKPTRTHSTKPIDSLVNCAINAQKYEPTTVEPAGSTWPERAARKWTEGMAQHFRRRFGEQLKSLREKAGLSLNGLAAKAGVDHSQLARLESAERSCTLETAVKIAGALGVSLGILVDEQCGAR